MLCKYFYILVELMNYYLHIMLFIYLFMILLIITKLFFNYLFCCLHDLLLIKHLFFL